MSLAHKIFGISVCTVFLILCSFVFFGCNEQQPQQNAVGFKDSSDVVLLLDIKNQNSVSLDALGENYSISFDQNILELSNNKIVAKSEGATKVVLTYFVDGQKITKSKVVSVVKPVFCGDAYLQQSYTFALDGSQVALEVLGLTQNYNFNTKYSTTSSCFSVNNNGTIVPQKVGQGELELKLVEGVDLQGNLVYKTLKTTINVVQNPTLQISVLDENKNELTTYNNVFNLTSDQTGKIYYFKYNTTNNFVASSASLNIVSQTNQIEQQNIVQINSGVDQDGLQQFVLYDVGECEFFVDVVARCYNKTQTLKSSSQKFVVFRQTIDLVANAKSVMFNDVVEDANEFWVYKLKPNTEQQARQDKVFSSIYIEFLTNEFTNQTPVVQVEDEFENVLLKGNGFVVNANNDGDCKFFVSAQGYSETFVVHITTFLPTKIDFAFANKTELVFEVGQSQNFVPTISPAYSVYQINYVFDSDLFEFEDGTLNPLSAGETTLTVFVNQTYKTYNLIIKNETICVFVSTSQVLDPVGTKIDYLVAKQNSSQDALNYSQDVELRFYDEQQNLLQSPSQIFVAYETNSFTIYLDQNFGCFVEVYSPTYFASSSKIWLQNN